MNNIMKISTVNRQVGRVKEGDTAKKLNERQQPFWRRHTKHID